MLSQFGQDVLMTEDKGLHGMQKCEVTLQVSHGITHQVAGSSQAVSAILFWFGFCFFSH